MHEYYNYDNICMRRMLSANDALATDIISILLKGL